jgi:hypothetical protein
LIIGSCTGTRNFLRKILGKIPAENVFGLFNALYEQNLEYLDKVTQKKEKEHRDEVTISSETDSVYHSAPDHVTIIDGETKISITKHNFSDYVIWNPHKEKCTTIADMGTDDWKVSTNKSGSETELCWC